MCHELLVKECNVISSKIFSYHRDKKFCVVNSHTHKHTHTHTQTHTTCPYLAEQFVTSSFVCFVSHKTCSRCAPNIDVPNPPSVVTRFDFQIEIFLRSLLAKVHRRLEWYHERCLGQTSFNVMLFSLDFM